MSGDPRVVKIGTIPEEEVFARALRFQLTVTLNPNISLKNKALLLIIDSYEGKVTVEEILRLSPDGKASVSAGLKELEVTGAIKRIRDRDNNGLYLPTRYEISIYSPENIEKAKQNYIELLNKQENKQEK